MAANIEKENITNIKIQLLDGIKKKKQKASTNANISCLLKPPNHSKQANARQMNLKIMCVEENDSEESRRKTAKHCGVYNVTMTFANNVACPKGWSRRRG